MRRYRQTFEELVGNLTAVETEWRDEFADRVISILDTFREKVPSTAGDVAGILRHDFNAGLTICRLFLDLSKDEFEGAFRAEVAGKGVGITHFRKDADGFVAGLTNLGLLDQMKAMTERPATWVDVVVERLKSGRGSAIKGQVRGRILEDFTEEIVKAVFGEGNYDVRCRFTGESGESTEKTDVAIPNKNQPQILIEVKAYGATGSKQTDVLGDITRIIDEMRNDTTFLLVTDGVTWKARANDLRKLIDLQNRGRIGRIYTRAMADDLRADLQALKGSLHL